MSLKVLLLGATGENGQWILQGLLEDGTFNVSALVRQQSLEKPAVQRLKDKHVSIVVGDSTMPVSDLTELLKGFDVVISSIDAGSQLAQFNLVDVAAAAGVKRFIPCGFSSVARPGGVLVLRDHKEEVHSRIFENHLPYTIVDVGFWHVLSYPDLPSGKVIYASPFLTQPTIYDGGNALNLLTHAEDVGKWLARIIKDERTLNKRVLSGEKIERNNHMSPDDMSARLTAVKEKYEAEESKSPWNPNVSVLYITQYLDSMFFRKDNTLENAKYLGYLDARELYPDFKPVTFAEFVKNELLTGRAIKPYAQLSK